MTKSSSGPVSHPFLKLFFWFWLVRLVVALVTFSIEQFGIIAPPFSAFLYAQLWQTGEILVFCILIYFLLKAGLHRVTLFMLVYVIILSLIIWTIADPIVFTLAGDHLSPSLLAHFAGFHIFFSDYLWKPVRANAGLVLTGLVAMITFLYLLFRVVKSAYRSPANFNLKTVLSIGALGTIFLFTPQLTGNPYFTYPPEVIFVRDYFGWNQLEASESDIEKLRAFLSRTGEKRWVSDKYPLMHEKEVSSTDSIPSKRPNIILLVIESFRAGDTRLYNPSSGKLALPGIEKFAVNAKIFPHFISNGFPSTEGFFSILTSTWPHSSLRVAQNFQQVEFDNIPTRLRNYGYTTYRIEDDPDFDEEGFWVRKYFDHSITFRDKGVFPSEKNMMDSVIAVVSKHQDRKPGWEPGWKPYREPYFIHLKTRGPHYPYELTDDNKEKFYSRGSPAEDYPISMQYVDKQILRLHDFLENSGGINNTVVIITGDHANYLDQAHKSGLPTDDIVWVGALFSGPEEVIGRPERIEEHASQVDLMPTILWLTGDTMTTAGFGSNLLGRPAHRPHHSVAVRPAGVRLDIGGYTYLADRRYPTSFYKTPAFGGRMQQQKNIQMVEAKELFKLIDTWSSLIEQNRVWSKPANPSSG